MLDDFVSLIPVKHREPASITARHPDFLSGSLGIQEKTRVQVLVMKCTQKKYDFDSLLEVLPPCIQNKKKELSKQLSAFQRAWHIFILQKN